MTLPVVPATRDRAARIAHAIDVMRALGPAPTRPLTRRETAALAILYRSYAPMLLAVARQLTRNDADAEDVVHDTFCRLPWIIALYRGGGFGGWVKQVTVRSALMRLRSARRRRESDLADEAEAPSGDVTRDDFLAVEDRDEVRWALGALDAPLRHVVALRFLLDYSHQEIADELRITVAASEIRLCRALKRLRELLRLAPTRARTRSA